MKNLLIPLAVLSLFAGSSLAQAGSSVDLKVNGKITPSACEPGLSNGGVYELGKIPAKGLNVDQPTPLTAKSLQMTLTCQALTLVAIRSVDNRPGSHYESDNLLRFGLGLVNGNEKVGGMGLSLESIVADGAPMYGIGSVGTTGWGPTQVLSPAFLTSFTHDISTPGMAPAPIQRLTADVLIEPKIAPANTLTLTGEVPIDGSATLDITYL
ncbi:MULTISPECIES: DUF1120 domain-containing protein [unclassified Pseudomonas]|uniref:DUF1120 domain-containing protein n=1 Tax=unclassified Pseudomonas TaxID=196821 RepID=UPI0030DB6F05